MNENLFFCTVSPALEIITHGQFDGAHVLEIFPEETRLKNGDNSRINDLLRPHNVLMPE